MYDHFVAHPSSHEEFTRLYESNVFVHGICGAHFTQNVKQKQAFLNIFPSLIYCINLSDMNTGGGRTISNPISPSLHLNVTHFSPMFHVLPLQDIRKTWVF